jgi:aminoglycoside/choline kinase family phosphotransferase
MHLAANAVEIDVKSLKDGLNQHFDASKDIKTVQLAGDASSRKYFRLSQGTKSFILQWADPFANEAADSHPYISAGHLFQSLGVNAPKILGSIPAKGWVLMEDLGDKTLSQDITIERYKISIDWIEKMISGVADGVATKSLQKFKGPHLGWAFDLEKLTFEMKHTATHLVDFYLKENSGKFLTLIENNSVYLAKRPRFFCHRDYHSRNLMLHNNSVYVIDFQDARMGPITYDVVSLLWDPYLELEENTRESLLEYWKTKMNEYSSSKRPGAGTVRAVFEEKVKKVAAWKIELERMKLQRLLKAAGSYASFLNLKGRKDYLPWIRPALERSLDALEKLKQYKAIENSEAGLLTLIPDYLKKL